MIHDLVVVGGGVHGSTAALFCARVGMRVVLLERDSLCRGASGVNAGTLTMQMTRVALVPYAMRGHAMWAGARQWLGHDVGVVVCDGLSLAFTEREAALLSERAARRRAAGAPISLIGADRARVIEPGLGAGVLLAGHCPVDGFANAHLTGLAFRRALLDAGVDVREGAAATGVSREDDGFAVLGAGGAVRARRLLLAGGVFLAPMLGWLGLRVGLKTLVNQVLVTERVAPVMRTVVGIASGLLSLKQFPHGSVVIGGGWQGRGDRTRGGAELDPDAVIGNARLAAHAIPALRGARLVRGWAGLEAETEDAMPLAGPLPGIPGAFVCGSVHSGYTSGPCIASLVAQRIMGQEPDMPLFPIDRLLPG